MKNIQSVCENLLKPVKIVEGIVEKRQTLPILSNILIEQNGENVKFSATDLDIQISTEAPVGVAGVDTRFTVGASKLASILTALPATNEVQFDLGDRGLTISSTASSSFRRSPPTNTPSSRKASGRRRSSSRPARCATCSR